MGYFPCLFSELDENLMCVNKIIFTQIWHIFLKIWTLNWCSKACKYLSIYHYGEIRHSLPFSQRDKSPVSKLILNFQFNFSSQKGIDGLKLYLQFDDQAVTFLNETSADKNNQMIKWETVFQNVKECLILVS